MSSGCGSGGAKQTQFVARIRGLFCFFRGNRDRGRLNLAVPDTFFGRQGWSRDLSVTFLGALD